MKEKCKECKRDLSEHDQAQFVKCMTDAGFNVEYTPRSAIAAGREAGIIRKIGQLGSDKNMMQIGFKGVEDIKHVKDVANMIFRRILSTGAKPVEPQPESQPAPELEPEADPEPEVELESEPEVLSKDSDKAFSQLFPDRKKEVDEED